ncbi:MAG: tRNA (adenosine(37)-N6)-threonylcarbamoyltransferase complex ATPase subunit type 1 TsaE [Chloroflexi bacterium]|nr:tRNA (adenosine(37)-N6)-threonylcarbamoyltransferase complex ATPase subunit type 1 TsaE [Chloroflexota bacterium]
MPRVRCHLDVCRRRICHYNQPVPIEWTTTTDSAAATRLLAARLAASLQAGDVLWLSGDLGAGKTTFTQGLGRGLGVDAPVTSPTFVLIRVYAGRLPLYHIDLYRLNGRAEIDNLGLRDYLDGAGVCVIEWGERLDPLGEQAGLHLRLEARGEQVPPSPTGSGMDRGQARALTFSASDERGNQLTALLRTQVETGMPTGRNP